MRVLDDRCAAVDVVAVAVRLPGKGPGGRVTVRRTYKAFYGVLAEMTRWLASEGVTHVAMEATGVYSMPACHALLEHGDFEQIWSATPPCRWRWRAGSASTTPCCAACT